MTKKTFDFKTITSFEDACKKEDLDPTQIPNVSRFDKGIGKTLIAVFRLIIIFQAINDGWKPNWNDLNEYKYFPWFVIQADAARPSGFGFSNSHCADWGTDAACGSRLCTNSSQKAHFIAQQFEAEYKDFILIQQ